MNPTRPLQDAHPALAAKRPDLRGKRVLVYGLGKSGAAAVQLLLREGARVVAVDDREEAELGAQAQELRAKGVEVRAGKANPVPPESVELVVLSPGVPLARPEL